MPHDLTHASFFTGVGGLDLGLERAGWRTVSHCEVDPYACAVLAARWPGVPNLGDIVQLAGQRDARGWEGEADTPCRPGERASALALRAYHAWRQATAPAHSEGGHPMPRKRRAGLAKAAPSKSGTMRRPPTTLVGTRPAPPAPAIKRSERDGLGGRRLGRSHQSVARPKPAGTKRGVPEKPRKS